MGKVAFLTLSHRSPGTQPTGQTNPAVLFLYTPVLGPVAQLGFQLLLSPFLTPSAFQPTKGCSLTTRKPPSMAPHVPGCFLSSPPVPACSATWLYNCQVDPRKLHVCSTPEPNSTFLDFSFSAAQFGSHGGVSSVTCGLKHAVF